MSLSDDARLESKKPRPSHPKGWEPGYEWDGATASGLLVTAPLAAEPDDWDALARELGVPSHLSVDTSQPIRFSSWDGWTRDGDDTVPARLTSYKVTLTSGGTEDVFAYPELARVIRKRKPAKVKPPTGDRWLVLPVADLQTGKRSGGGLEGLTDRMKQVESNLVAHVRNLRKTGVELAGLAVVGMGDIVENCSGFYPSMQGETSVGLRDQKRAAKDLIWSLLDVAAPLFQQVLVSAVAGNHGEYRGRGPGAITNPRQDNMDLEVFDWLADKMWDVDRYSHVQFKIPEDQLATSFDIGGTIVGFTHGHQFDRGSGLPIQKAIRWWEGQQLGRRATADADVMVYAHFHHPVVMELSQGRWLVQCPTIDGGSNYFEESTGRSSSPGMCCFVTGSGSLVEHWRIL